MKPVFADSSSLLNSELELASAEETLKTALAKSLEVLPSKLPLKLSKQAIRSSLKASTLDAVFASMFSNISGGVLLGNFLLELGATPVEIGMLSSIPMLVNLLQPLGAYFAERTTSRHWYGVWIYSPSRLLWLILVFLIGVNIWHPIGNHQLISWTLGIVLVTHLMSALGCASWLSWMAALVPHRLRGRYFGFRNSAANLSLLICMPLLGLFVSSWPSGTVQGYGVVLLLGVVFGIISLSFQFFMADVNPQEQQATAKDSAELADESVSVSLTSDACTDDQLIASTTANFWLKTPDFFKNTNFLKFLLYFGLWTFAVNVSAPFFNLYLLDNLDINVSWVTLYSSLMAGANLLMLMVWGKLADRFGNRPLLVLVGILVAVTPLLWLGTGTNAVSLWVWFPLLHLLMGGTWAAIDLCSNNMMMGIAPTNNHAKYFAIVGAVAGVSGAIGTTAGGFLAQFADYGGLPGLFALSAVLRLAALLPLVFVHEQRSQSLTQLMRSFLPAKTQPLSVQPVKLVNESK